MFRLLKNAFEKETQHQFAQIHSRFFFAGKGAKKKTLLRSYWEKESAKRIFRPLRRATKAPRLGWRRLPKKAGENFLLFYSADAFISSPEPF